MSDCIETVIEEHERHVAALKKVAKQYPRCTAQHYEDITVWVVDMPHEECKSFRTWSTNVGGTPGGTIHGHAIIYKNIDAGVNIAPKKHYLPLSLFNHYITSSSHVVESLAQLFKEHA